MMFLIIVLEILLATTAETDDDKIYSSGYILPLFQAEIIIAPSPMIAPLFTLANFTCEGIGDVLFWSVQDNPLDDPSNQDREISVTTNNISVDVWSTVLTIRALPINSGISAGCTVISNNPQSFKNKGANLTIKG